jgi:hypothetical protein
MFSGSQGDYENVIHRFCRPPHYISHSSSPSSSSLPLSLIPLHPPPHYLSLSFLSILLLTTSLPPSFPSSSSLPLPSFLFYFSPSLLSSSYYLSPFFFSLLLTASLPHFHPSVVLENHSIRMFKVSYRSAQKKQHLCSTS